MSEAIHQPVPVKGYRGLSQAEIDLMNKIKGLGLELADLIKEVQNHVHSQFAGLEPFMDNPELDRLLEADPHKWIYEAKINYQTAQMQLIRAVAQPSGM